MLNLKNSSFHRFGSEFATLIDKNHFLGHSSLHARWYKNGASIQNDFPKEHLYSFYVSVEGFSKEELHLELVGKFLKITGLKEDMPNIKNNFITLVEKTISFEQIYELSSEVNRDEIQAIYKDGELEITFSSNLMNEKTGIEKIRID